MVLITIFAIVVLAGVAKLIYDTQQKKKQTPTKTIDDFEFKDDFQKLAGIKPINENDEIRQIFVKNNAEGKQQIIEALLKAAENSEFPKQDESINMGTTKIGAINTNFGDNDPLATIPMSRVSKEGKKKMAEIAKEDIKVTTEAKANELISKGLVTIPAETKPKRKSNPKQMDGTKTDAPFVKTKKKSTKPKV
jgi:hypothetical protein